MAKKLTKAEKIAQIPIEEIGKLKGEAGEKMQREYLKTLAMGYKRRVASFKRKGLFSYAQDAYEGYHPSISAKDIKKMNRNQRVLEIAKLQHFFNAKTSSEAGIKEVNRHQDARIFGVDEKGRPLGTMDTDTRRFFWRLYDEFLIQHPTRYPESSSVQQNLASVLFPMQELDSDESDEAEESETIEPFDIVQLMETLEEIMKNQGDIVEDKDDSGGPNVYMGRGPTFGG